MTAEAAGGKAAVRAQVRQRLASLAPARRALEEELVAAAIQDTPQWRSAGTVLLYRSQAPEFSTVGLVLGAWRSGKTTLFPRVGADGGLELVAASSWESFRPGYRGLLEPVGPPAAVVAPQALSATDLAIVPGVAFDRHGGRLGRGGGHFDRLLPHLACPVWGIAFDAQVVPAVPRDGHDVQVAQVWTGSAVGGPPWP